jgi:hypothetical protein
MMPPMPVWLLEEEMEAWLTDMGEDNPPLSVEQAKDITLCETPGGED